MDKPKASKVSGVAEYNEQGNEICPACKERKYKIIRCSVPKEGEIRFNAQCSCGHEFYYVRDTKLLWKKGTNEPLKNTPDKLCELPRPADRPSEPPRRGLDRPKRERKK